MSIARRFARDGEAGYSLTQCRSTNRRVARALDRSHGRLDLAQIGHAGRDEQGACPCLATCDRKGRLVSLTGGDLERGHAQLLEEVGALLVERRGEERDAQVHCTVGGWARGRRG